MSPSTAFGSRRTLFIQTESTPSDDAIRFKPGTAVLGPDAKSTVEFTSRGAAQSGGSPLAASLLSIDGILSVLFSTDAVTITKDATTPWQLVKPDVFGALTDHFGQSPVPPVADPSLASSPPEDTVVRADDSEVVAMIKELLDTRIRPTIQDDGGDIEYMGFDESEGTVKLKLKGACRTCDSSVVTLKNGIENMLQYFIPEVKKVEQVLDVAEQVAKEEFDKMEHKLMAAAEEASNFGSVQLKQ
ncbi:HIRA-interacting protein 5 [Blastocladiella britannica]|nr:HIRA-interacting protein 5 [Blastocladiella britannica]